MKQRMITAFIVTTAAALLAVPAYGQTASEPEPANPAQVQTEESVNRPAFEDDAAQGHGVESEAAQSQDVEQNADAQLPRDIFDDIADDVASGEFDQSCSVPVG